PSGGRSLGRRRRVPASSRRRRGPGDAPLAPRARRAPVPRGPRRGGRAPARVERARAPRRGRRPPPPRRAALPRRLAQAPRAADRSPAPPWGRPVTPPGSAPCDILVRWDGAGLSYPAVVDPEWTPTNGGLNIGRFYHTANLVHGQNNAAYVLVAGGAVDASST